MTCPEFASKREITKKVPSTMTVQKLKQLVQRLFKADINAQELDSGVMQLYYISQEVQFLVHVLYIEISSSLQLFPYARLCF